MTQPAGQVLLNSGHAFYGHFWYANGAGLWDARNGVMATKTGTGAVTATGSAGENVVTTDGTTRYAPPSAIVLSYPFTVAFKVKRSSATGDAGVIVGNTDGDAGNYVWLRGSGIRAFNSDPIANSSPETWATFHISKQSNGVVSLYKNGAFVADGAWSGGTTTISSILSGYTGNSIALIGSLEYLHIIPGVAIDAMQAASLYADPYQVLQAAGGTNADAPGGTGTSTGSGSGGTATGVTAGEAISITAPVQYKMHQRTGNVASIAIAGTYTGTPTSIEARFNGGAWTVISASPTGGSYSGTLANCATGQGALDVRFSNSVGTTASVGFIGVGDIYMVAGQSNNSGRATGIVSPVASAFTAVEYTNGGAWVALRESVTTSVSFDDGEGQGSYFGQLSNLLQARGAPVAFVPCAAGSTTIADWTRYDPSPQNTYNLYGNMWTRAIAVGGHKAMIFWQGEGDTSTDQTVYEAALNKMINDWYSDTGKPTFLIKICSWTAAADPVRATQDLVIASNPHVVGSADANVWTSGSVHYITTAEVNAVAAAVYAGMSAAFYDKTARIRLVDESGTPLASLTGIKWAWHDVATPDSYSAPTDKGTGETTDASGYLQVLINNSALSSGGIGSLEISTSDGTTTQSPSPRGWAGPVAVD